MQGEVFRARKARPTEPVHFGRVSETIRVCAAYTYGDERQKAAEELVSFIRDIAAESVARDRAQIAALKLLHPNEDRVASEKAAARMMQEVSALTRFRHPSLLRILEANLDEKWFVMEYFSRGTLYCHLGQFRGEVLTALRTFRPLVEAVSELHKNGYVHRDIKPANVFVADDGHLVLGDFGIALDVAAGPRVTDEYENVGSRDWMPGWAMGIKTRTSSPPSTFSVWEITLVHDFRKAVHPSLVIIENRSLMSSSCSRKPRYELGFENIRSMHRRERARLPSRRSATPWRHR